MEINKEKPQDREEMQIKTIVHHHKTNAHPVPEQQLPGQPSLSFLC